MESKRRGEDPLKPEMGERRGFVLVTMALTAVALFGVLGLAVDIGRIFIAKNETQAYCDAAAPASGDRHKLPAGFRVAKTSLLGGLHHEISWWGRPHNNDSFFCGPQPK
jgi:hypothetical protein